MPPKSAPKPVVATPKPIPIIDAEHDALDYLMRSPWVALDLTTSPTVKDEIDIVIKKKTEELSLLSKQAE